MPTAAVSPQIDAAVLAQRAVRQVVSAAGETRRETAAAVLLGPLTRSERMQLVRVLDGDEKERERQRQRRTLLS